MFDMFKMLGKLNDVQSRMKEAKEKLSNVTLTESELGGVVIITITGGKKVLNIKTAPEFYEKYSIEEREAILTEATNNALNQAEAYSKEFMAQEMKDVIPNIPGLDLADMPFFN